MIKRTAMLSVLGLAAFGSMAAAEQINFSTYVPASDLALTAGIQPMLDKITADTNGDLTFQVFTAGQMFGPLDTLAGVQSGAVGGGTVFAGFYGTELPYAAFLEDSVALNSDSVAAVGAALETYFIDCEECKAEDDAAGIVTLGGHGLSPYVLLCTKEVTSVADLAGLRVRGSTGLMNTAIGLMGANGVNVAFNEVSQAFERGNIDCMIGNANWIGMFGLSELIKTIVTEPTMGIAPTTTFMSFNRDTWDSFDDATKKIILDAMPGYIANGTLGYLDLDAQSIEAAVAGGGQIVDLGAEFGSMRDDLTAAETNRILTQAAERGIADPQALLALYQENYAKWLEISAEVNNDPAAFEAALRREIYDNLSL